MIYDPKASEGRRRAGSARMEMLTRERESILARRWSERSDETALHELINAHTPLVAGVIGKYRGRNISTGDLFQEGCVGLMQAAARFDPERGVRFSTYAVWWVRAAIRAYLIRNASVVRAASPRPGRPRAWWTRADQSLDIPVVAGGEALRDLLVDERPTPEEATESENERSTRVRWLTDALDALPARERMIIRERHLSDDSRTLAELGDRLGVSKERVRQLEKKAIGRLRQAMCAQDDGSASGTPSPCMS